MATKKLEELTIEQLKKREKSATILLIICLIGYITVGVLNLVFVYLKHTKESALMPIASGLLILLIIAMGRKKIKDEIKKRENAI
jgi:hypothetical protein